MNAVFEQIHEVADQIETLLQQLDPLDHEVFFTRCSIAKDPKLVYTEMWFERVNARDFAVYTIAQGDTLQEIHNRFQPPITLERLAFINNISDPVKPPVGLLITLRDIK